MNMFNFTIAICGSFLGKGFLFVCQLSIVIIFAMFKETSSIEELGHSAVYRDHKDTVKKAILIPDPPQTVRDAGLVVGMHVYTMSSRRNQEVHVQIWRPSGQRVIASNLKYSYTLVGDVKLVSLWAGYGHVLLYPEDRIQVQKGDAVGLYFPNFNPIPWEELVPCSNEKKHRFFYNPRDLKIGKDLLFSTAFPEWSPCRIYSFNVTVMSSTAAEKMDGRLEIRQIKPYGRKPYGKYIPEVLPVISDTAQTLSTTYIFLVTFTTSLLIIIKP